MDKPLTLFDKLVARTKKKIPGYRFSWEIYTDLILENVAKKPYWLDIGAGSNLIIKEQPGAALAVGLDIEKQSDIFVNHYNGGYLVADSGKLPLKDNSFDFITSRYTFEHLQSPESVLDEIYRVLKPDGAFVLQTTNIKSPVIFVANLIPHRLKKSLLKLAFGEIPSGTFKTYYRLNTPRAIRSLQSSLKLTRLITIEDLFCQNRALYYPSLLIFKLLSLFGRSDSMNNIIVIYRKE